jgi:hypothetical protein
LRRACGSTPARPTTRELGTIPGTPPATWRIVVRVPQNQLIGLALMALAVVDTAVGHLLIAPRVAEEPKRTILKVAFSISGVGIAAVGWAIYKGMIAI